MWNMCEGHAMPVPRDVADDWIHLLQQACLSVAPILSPVLFERINHD